MSGCGPKSHDIILMRVEVMHDRKEQGPDGHK